MADTPPPAPWWRSAVVYQIYPRSFCDRSGDGVGDLAGVRAHLDHLQWLGVDAVWLSPIFSSPMADFGYDVSDYCDVDPLFGSLAELDDLIDEAHGRGLKIILDWVPNHTSDAHPWFIASRSSRDDPKRDWYIWRDGAAGGPPNNWKAAFKGVGGTEFPPAWTWDEATGQWYLHLFLDRQPDLNWANPEVRAAMADVLRFWLDRGVDGFRMDVVHNIGKSADLADLPPELVGIPMCALIDEPVAHEYIRTIRAVMSEAPPPDRVAIGEIILPTVAQIASYYGSPEAPELDLAFNFRPLHTPWDAALWRRQVDEVAATVGPAGGWPTWVLSNHDNPRHRSRYGGSEPRARAAAVLLLTLPGTPFLYAGEEIGLEDAEVPRERAVDPGGRDGCRAPLPWSPAGASWSPSGAPAGASGTGDGGDPDSGAHGWAGPPWLPWPPEADSGRDVESQRSDPSSTLNLYRRLLEVRRSSSALLTGAFAWADAAPGVLAYTRTAVGLEAGTGEECLVAVNFTASPAWVLLPSGDWEVLVSSSGRAWPPVPSGEVELGPDEAAILRRRGEPRGRESAP